MKTDSGIFREGTYEWNITFLTLMYDDKAETVSYTHLDVYKRQELLPDGNCSASCSCTISLQTGAGSA